MENREWDGFAQFFRSISRQAAAVRQYGHAKASGELASLVFRWRTPEQSGEVTSKMSLIEVPQRCGELRERLVSPLRKSPGCLLKAVPPNHPLGGDADILPKQPLHRSNGHSHLAGERLGLLRAVLTAGPRNDRAHHLNGRVRSRQSGVEDRFNGTDHGPMIPGAEDPGLGLIVSDASYDFGRNRSVRQGRDWLCQEWSYASRPKAQSDDPTSPLERAAMDTPDHAEQLGLPSPDDKIGIGAGSTFWTSGGRPVRSHSIIQMLSTNGARRAGGLWRSTRIRRAVPTGSIMPRGTRVSCSSKSAIASSCTTPSLAVPQPAARTPAAGTLSFWSSHASHQVRKPPTTALHRTVRLAVPEKMRSGPHMG